MSARPPQSLTCQERETYRQAAIDRLERLLRLMRTREAIVSFAEVSVTAAPALDQPYTLELRLKSPALELSVDVLMPPKQPQGKLF